MDSVLNFGADPTGAANSGAAFNAALATAQRITVPKGTYKIDVTVDVKPNAHLDMEPGAVLSPTADNLNVVRLRPSGMITGGNIDTRSRPNWWATCIDINGDDEAQPVKFRLDVPTVVRDIKLWGRLKFGGVGVNCHSDGIANARIMGLDIEFRAFGLEIPLWIKVGPNVGSQFVNANRFKFFCSDSWRAFIMAGGNGDDIAGNDIWYQHQPDYAVTPPSAEIKGQMNRIYALPWDWSHTQSGTAVLVQPGSSNNWIDMPQYTQYYADNSGNSTNICRKLI